VGEATLESLARKQVAHFVFAGWLIVLSKMSEIAKGHPKLSNQQEEPGYQKMRKVIRIHKRPSYPRGGELISRREIPE